MRKIFFIAITLLVMNVSSISAQAVWGVRMGLSYFTETIDVSEIGMSYKGNVPGIELGPILYYSLKDNLYLNSGVLVGVLIPESFEGFDRSEALTCFIDIPLYGGVKIPVSSSNFSFYGQAGPFVGYSFSTDSYTNEMINPFRAGLAAMAGINIKRFKFEFGYKAGLTNQTSNEGGYLDDTYMLKSTSKLSSLFLGISYVF
jgi:hypothetical protein